MSYTPNKIKTIIEKSTVAKHYLYSINLKWRNIFGSYLSKVCSPVKVTKNVLYVSVKNHSWIQELIFSKKNILKKMKKFDIFIDDIKFLIESKETLSTKLVENANLNKDELEFIKDVSYPLSDKELKKSFQNLLKTYLKKGKKL